MADVFILDANALIDMKALPVTRQWDFFLDLEARVKAGEIAIPLHVIREVSRVPHPDMPGAWAKGMEKRTVYVLEADPHHVARVMSETPDVLDVDADTEQADPYVIALALHLTSDGHHAIVVTKDKKDRPPRISVRTACARLGVDCVSLEDFLTAITT